MSKTQSDIQNIAQSLIIVTDIDISHVDTREYRKGKGIGSQWKADISKTTIKSLVCKTLTKMGRTRECENIWQNISAADGFKGTKFRY
jgi:hypothetical protein